MSATSAGLADNERDPLGDNGTHVGDFSRPPKTTNSAHRPSTPITFAPAAKNKAWQPSNGILFGHAKTVTGNAASTSCGKHSPYFSTAARQCSQPKSLLPKAIPIRPYRPAIRPYTPNKEIMDRLFMSDEDGNDGFGEGEEDIGELLTQSELSDEGFYECSMIGTEPIQEPQQLSETEAKHRNPKAPINLQVPARNSLHGVVIVKKPKAEQPPKLRNASTKVLVPVNGIPATVITFAAKALLASYDSLQKALMGLTIYGVWGTAPDRELSPNTRTECEGSAHSHSPYEYAIAKQAADTGQEVVRNLGMTGLENKRLRRKPKDQIQTISAKTRCYSTQSLQPTPERSKSPSALHDYYSYTSRAHVDLLQRKQVTAGIAKRQSTRNITQSTHIDDVSPLEDLPQPRVSAAAKHPSSHSPKGFAMSCSEISSDTNDTPIMRPVNWSYALYTGPKNERVKVHYCQNKVDTERVAQLFRDEDIVGFDIEWKANAQAKDGIKKNVSLIQMASEERVALFHIARYRDEESLESLVTPTLKDIMESPHISKVGVNIKGDCTRLHRFLGIESRGLFELSHLYKLVKYSGGDTSNINRKPVRLATQVEEHLGLPLLKGNARTSDWSLALNFNQVQYAASDSYAGFQLFHEMEHKRKQLIPTPPRPYHAELDRPIRLTSGESIETDDEPEDMIDELSMTSPPSSTEELARDFKIKLTCPTPPIRQLPNRIEKPSPQPCKPEVIIANEWVANWHSTRPPGYKSAAARACLRAHALWHEQGFTVPEAAALLRNPPLLNATVAAYVLDALLVENLPFEKDRLAALILHVPQAMKGRYKRFFKKAGIDVL